jgi:hypothetical protein
MTSHLGGVVFVFGVVRWWILLFLYFGGLVLA